MVLPKTGTFILLLSPHRFSSRGPRRVCVPGQKTRGAGGTQAGAAGLVGDEWWALPFHDPRAICLVGQRLRSSDTEGPEGRCPHSHVGKPTTHFQ